MARLASRHIQRRMERRVHRDSRRDLHVRHRVRRRIVALCGSRAGGGQRRLAQHTARPAVEAFLLAIGAVVLLFALPHEIASDGAARFYALAQLLDWHEVSGTAYSLVGPLFSAPLYLLGKQWMTSEWWVSRFNAIAFVA